MTITITFSKELLGSISYVVLLLWVWIDFVTSIIFGVLTLMALAEELGQRKENSSITVSQHEGIYSNSVRLFASLHLITFVVALILSITYGYKSVSASIPAQKQKQSIQVVDTIDCQADNVIKVDTIIFMKDKK